MDKYADQAIEEQCRDIRRTPSRKQIIAESILHDPLNSKIIRYRWVHGLDYNEISVLTGVKPKTLQKRLERLQKKVPILSEMSH